MSEDTVNDLVVRAYNLTEAVRRVSLLTLDIERELDKLRSACETLSESLTIQVKKRAKGPKEQPVAEPPGLRQMCDEEWQALMGETPPPARQLSFHPSEPTSEA